MKNENLKQTVISHLEEGSTESLKNLLSQTERIEILDIIHDLTPQEQLIVFRLLSKNNALYVFEQLDTTLQQQLLNSFTDENAIDIVNKMTPDDRVALLEELPANVVKKLIQGLSPEERQVTNLLLGYEEETAGRIMTTEFISLKQQFTASAALDKVRLQAVEKETIYTLYVTSASGKLEGVLSLKDLLIADLESNVGDIMTKAVINVTTSTDQEEVAIMMEELDLLAIPVVDSENRMVGIVTIDDAMDILKEEVTEDIYDQAGLADITNRETNRSEVLVNGNLWSIWKVRLPFLLITLVAGMLSGNIIANFEETLESVAAVAIFIPLIMDMGGNVGNQSSTLFSRGVIVGHIKMKNFGKHFAKEILVGFSIGAVVGIVAGIIAAVWQGMPMLGLSVGLALVCTMTLAAALGFTIPFLLMKFNVDQTAGSGPIITSIKDMAGLTIYFLFVSYFLGHLL